MVRMSDLVRGIHREMAPPPSRERAITRREVVVPQRPPHDDGPIPPPVRFPVEAIRPRPVPPRVESPPPSRSVVSPFRPSTPSAREAERPVEPGPEPSPAPEQGPTPEALYAEILGFLSRIPGLLREGGDFPWEECQALVEQVIRSLEASSDLFWLANSPPPSGTDYLVAHLANVGIFSLKIGMGQGYDRRRLAELGLAALVFDVGMWRLPDAVLKKTDQLSEEDVASIQSHSRVGTEIVRRWRPPFPEMAEMILHHHEREQGQGYPDRLMGDAIRPGAKIIGLADTYAALIHPRPYRSKFHPHEAVREIVRSKNEGFPTHLVKALLAEISVFPPRTVVKLNTGEVGRVIAVNRNHPLRPKIEIFADAKGNRLSTSKKLDLSEAPFIYITGPLQEATR